MFKLKHYTTVIPSVIYPMLKFFLFTKKNQLAQRLTFRWLCIVINSYNKTNQMHKFLRFIFGIKLYMLRTIPVSIMRSFSLYIQHWYMSYRFADSLQAGSEGFRPDPARKPSAHIALLCVH